MHIHVRESDGLGACAPNPEPAGARHMRVSPFSVRPGRNIVRLSTEVVGGAGRPDAGGTQDEEDTRSPRDHGHGPFAPGLCAERTSSRRCGGRHFRFHAAAHPVPGRSWTQGSLLPAVEEEHLREEGRRQVRGMELHLRQLGQAALPHALTRLCRPGRPRGAGAEREELGPRAHICHGLTISSPSIRKSLTLRVTRRRP